ncbi:MAG: leucyl/phenylalanyl-tRNA--protein transferase [Bacteriovoracaceae bacterium]|jgi:leucyl/phenylalanyl-tRNA--protein transferase|nr:leucyl/phenylalanyl-tRNA--protein transferase [Bacteriovoracaceae bacterium]
MFKINKSIFPDPSLADENGLLAIGADLSIETLIDAYTHGVFPWPVDKEYPLTWFSLDPRGVLFCDNLHISRSMRRFINKDQYQIKFNTDFESIITKCAYIDRKDQEDTWISEDIINAYIRMFNHKFAYCIGIYNEEDALIAGLYGVCIGELISAESMFHTESNTSKLAVIALVEKLRSKNIPFVDTQMVTPITKDMGAIQIKRQEFLLSLKTLDINKSRFDIFNS